MNPRLARFLQRRQVLRPTPLRSTRQMVAIIISSSLVVGLISAGISYLLLS